MAKHAEASPDFTFRDRDRDREDSGNGDHDKEENEETLGISIDVWGPSTWKSMNAIAFTFPDEPTEDQRRAYHTWFTLFTEVLPCQECREHYRQLLKTHPIDTRSRSHLTRWLVEAHNAVNKRLKRKTMTFEEAVRQNMPPEMRSALLHPTPAATAYIKQHQPRDSQLAATAATVVPGASQQSCDNGGWGATQIAIVAVVSLILIALLIVVIVLFVKSNARDSATRGNFAPKRVS